MTPAEVAPTVEVLFESTHPRDQSSVKFELVTHASGRPPALSITRVTASRGSYRVSLSPMLRSDVADAVKRWCAACDLHEATPRPRPHVVRAPTSRPARTSERGR